MLSATSRVVQVAGWIFWHASLCCLLDLPRALLRRQSIATAMGVRLSRLLESLGPTAIKFGQILSSRPDLLPPEITGPLGRLRDRLKPFPTSTAIRIVETALERPLTTVFSEFNAEPIAAASIAQVHRARLLDGREVAVKIRRPGVERTIDEDVALLYRFAGILARLPGMSLLPVEELVEEIMLPVYEQLDFELEAINIRQLRKNFDAVERIAIPAVVDEWSTANVLVMEYFGGLRRIGDASLETKDARAVALAGLRALYRMIFIDGFVHADMHPGNLLLRDRLEVALLDAGLVVRLDEERRQDFVDFFFALVNNQGRECARIVLKNADRVPDAELLERFHEEMELLIARQSALRSSEFEIAIFVHQLIATQRRCRVRGSTAFMMIVIAMAVYDGICKQLYPDCDFQSEARPFLIVGRYARRPLAFSAAGA